MKVSWRVLAWMALTGVWLTAGAQAQPNTFREGGRYYPFLEQQLGGVRLGMQARTLTGLWNLDGVGAAEQRRLRATYRMPDFIITRMGTRMPLADPLHNPIVPTPHGAEIFLYNAYGRYAVETGGGTAQGMAEAAGPSDTAVDAKVREHLAQAQLVGGVIAPAPSIAGPTRSAGEFATPATRAAGAAGENQAGEAAGGAAPGAGGGGAPGAAGEVQAGLLRDLPTMPIPVYPGPYEELRSLYFASRDEVQQRLDELVSRFYDLQRRAQLALQKNQTSQIYSYTTEMARIKGKVEQIQEIQSLPEVFSVFHPGHADRDIVFIYEPQPDVWLSFSINFYTWQINGITVTGYKPWDGARTSTAESGVPGIGLGDSLERVFNRYGWPDSWESYYGRYMMVNYYDTNNVSFLVDHPAPKVYRVVRIIIEPRPQAHERQLAGFRLGQNAQDLLVYRSRQGNGPIAYGQPKHIERPNHRMSMVNPGAYVQPDNRPPGLLMDRRLSEVIIASLGSGGGAGGAAGGGGEGAPPAEAQAARGETTAAATARGGRPVAQGQAAGRPVAQAQGAPPSAAGAAAGGQGNSAPVLRAVPMPFFYTRQGWNVEELCTPLTGADAERAGLRDALNEIYEDPSEQVGFGLAYGGRSSNVWCYLNTMVSETDLRFDYRFDNDVRVEFGLDQDSLTTQISLMGSRWDGARTERGVGLGMDLRTVLLRYGPPLMYGPVVLDTGVQNPNLSVMSYATDDRGQPFGNLTFSLQNKQVTAIQIVQLGVR